MAIKYQSIAEIITISNRNQMSAKSINENKIPPRKALNLIEGLTNYLHYLSDMGCTGFDCSKESLKLIESLSTTCQTLDEIESRIKNCKLCELSLRRTNIIFGAGNKKARLIFIGGAPSLDDDKNGTPFTGAAGDLLTNIIKAMELTRDDVYLCTLVKCFPQGNKKPTQKEIKTCLPFLKEQIETIKPEFICTLGETAAQTLLNTSEPLSVLRGKFHNYNGMQLIPTYHPSHLLKNPEDKRPVWEDMKKIMKEYKKNK